VAAGLVDFLHDDAGLGQAKAQAAVLGGDQSREQAGLGERVHKLLRVTAVAVRFAPVRVREAGAQEAGLLAQLVQSGGEGMHRCSFERVDGDLLSLLGHDDTPIY
jgi:hypothetical protein